MLIRSHRLQDCQVQVYRVTFVVVVPATWPSLAYDSINSGHGYGTHPDETTLLFMKVISESASSICSWWLLHAGSGLQSLLAAPPPPPPPPPPRGPHTQMGAHVCGVADGMQNVLHGLYDAEFAQVRLKMEMPDHSHQTLCWLYGRRFPPPPPHQTSVSCQAVHMQRLSQGVPAFKEPTSLILTLIDVS